MARITEHYRDETYRVYITDALKTITENTAKYAGGEYMKTRYVDIVRPKPVDNRSAEEIIATIKAKLGGEQG